MMHDFTKRAVLAGIAAAVVIGADASMARADEPAQDPIAFVTVAEPEKPFRFAVEVGGGSVIRFDALDETGNAFGGLLLARFDAFTVGLGAAVVMPDARLQANFAVLWAEGRYAVADIALGGSTLTPYGVLGFGFALSDEFLPPRTGFIPARWSLDGSPVVTYGAGARYGSTDGMYLSLEARAFNHTHLGLQLLLGYTLW